jgi:hypothetical protein
MTKSAHAMGGLLEWYPNAKAPKEPEGIAGRSAKAKKHKRATAAASKRKASAPTGQPDTEAPASAAKGAQQTVAKSIENVMRDKEDFMKVPEIVEALAAAGTPLKGKNPATHVGSVLSRGKQFYSEKGKGWRLRAPDNNPTEIGPQESLAPAARS